MIGRRLGSYEIVAKLGEGGMGEVWRARDSQLGRDVALKVLPDAFTADPERLQRFEREAKLLAQLNHPNIAQIYGLETSGDTRALVMELVEGPTLAERLESGPLSLNESLSVSLQIAQALEEAHEKGIVHRDLKPQNIKASIEGKVKVLDFGLAKAMDSADAASGPGSASQLAHSPTLTLGATQIGVILGTAAYMAPEQAKGLPIDKRADIWAFGVILFEMLAGGGRLFTGDSVTDTLAAVLRQEIDWKLLPAEVPPSVRHLLERCLARDRKQRLHDIGDARLELETALAPGASRGASPAAAAPAPGLFRRSAWPLATLTTLVALAVLIFSGVANRRALENRTPRFVLTVTLPEDVQLQSSGADAGPATISPSGRRIAFGARRGAGPTQLWVRELDQPTARPIEGTEGANHPFWSPDEATLGFFSTGQLRKVAAVGGPVLTLAAAVDPRGGAWGRDGTILFAPNYVGPLLRISADGGEMRPATKLDSTRDDDTHRYPHFLPDGRHFLYLARAGWKGSLFLGSLDSEERTLVADDVWNAQVSAGQLLFARKGLLMAQPFDATRFVTSGAARPLIDRLLVDERFALGIFSASEAGVLAYQTGQEVRMSQLAWFDRTGKRLATASDRGRAAGGYCPPALSPDGQQAVTCRQDDLGASADLWIVDLARSTSSSLTSGEDDEGSPVWSADSTSVAYGIFAAPGKSAKVFVRRRGADPSTIYEEKGASGLWPLSWSRDGRFLTIQRQSDDSDETGDILLVNLREPGKAPPLFAGKPYYESAEISPDGQWLAYSSDESGRVEIYLTRFPDLGGTQRVSRSGGIHAEWRGDGKEIFFRDPENWLVASELDRDRDGEIAVGRQSRLFQFLGDYAVSADGDRFLIEEPISEGDVSPITIRTGWTEQTKAH